MGPKDNWPNGYGFEYFYGFLAGETSQYEPRLFENYNPVEPEYSDTYHLTEDITEKALEWLGQHKSFSPDKPFFMYWAPGLCMVRITSLRSGLISTRANLTMVGTLIDSVFLKGNWNWGSSR